jgi:alpha/beta superfamily hydrolase
MRSLGCIDEGIDGPAKDYEDALAWVRAQLDAVKESNLSGGDL